MLSTCRYYRRTQTVLLFDLFYPLFWMVMYPYVNVASTVGSFSDWSWRLFFGVLIIVMIFYSGKALLKTFMCRDIPTVYRGMLFWLSISLVFCTVQWTANGVLGYWGAFWITLILRFCLVVMSSLFILDVRRLSRDSILLQNLQQGIQMSSSGSGSGFSNPLSKCNIL